MTNPAPDLFTAAGVEAPAKSPPKKRLTTCAVRLTDEQMARVKSLGNGNITNGFRKLVDGTSPRQVTWDHLDKLAAAGFTSVHDVGRVDTPDGLSERARAFLADPKDDAKIDQVRQGKPLPQPKAVSFDGETYDPLRDYARLTRQIKDVWDVLANYGDRESWYSLVGIQDIIRQKAGHFHSLPGISARLRDLRKAKYGYWNVERKPSGTRGLWLYRLEPNSYAARLAQYQDSLKPKVREHPTGTGKAPVLPGFEQYVEGGE